jgi:hypothetical protein
LQLACVKTTDFQVNHHVGSEVVPEALSFQAPGNGSFAGIDGNCAGQIELARADGGDAGTRPCCGDGVPDLVYGEECDFGNLNGVPLDTTSWPWTPNPGGTVWCDLNCRNPYPLCEPEARLGGMYCD